MSQRPGDPGYAPHWCVHFRSMGEHETCEAGVAYADFRGTAFACRPCFLTEKGESKAGALPCPSLRRPTPEEVAAHEAWIGARMERMRAVMVGIAPWRRAHKGRSAREVVACPACKGRLHLSIAAYNGHVHGRCETEGCVSWTE